MPKIQQHFTFRIPMPQTSKVRNMPVTTNQGHLEVSGVGYCSDKFDTDTYGWDDVTIDYIDLNGKREPLSLTGLMFLNGWELPDNITEPIISHLQYLFIGADDTDDRDELTAAHRAVEAGDFGGDNITLAIAAISRNYAASINAKTPQI